MQPTSRSVPGAHGLSLHLLEWSGAGSPILFLHGFGMSARVWDPFAAPLSASRRVLALDARGHGDSDHDPEFRYSHATVTVDVEAVVDHLGIERLALVGHSMGGYASLRFAARHPERVERLVLVDAGPDLSLRDRETREPARRPPKPGFESERAYASALGEMFPRAEPERLADLAHHWLRRRDDGRFEPKLDPAFLRPKTGVDPENRHRFDRQEWAREETDRLWRCLAEIPCPILVLRGVDSNVLTEATVERMLRESPADVRAVTVPGAGHNVMLDAPGELRAALREFFPND